MKNYRLLLLCVILLSAVYMTLAQTDCPPEKVCITREAAIKALTDSDTVKAQEAQIAALKQAADDLKTEVVKMQIELARVTGQLTGSQQMEVSQRAIITALLPMVRKKRVALITIF